LNNEWGNYSFANNSALLVPQNAANVGGTTRPTFRLGAANGEPLSKSFGTTQNITSTYYMQFGFRYNFQ
jgi:hypothetical protein